MTTVAVIPARGGSKRLPGKNIKPLAGKPLIAWTIEAALESECFDKVVVSTESIEIAEVARKYGAEIPYLRPIELASDTAATGPVLEHIVKYIEDRDSINCEKLCLLQPTSPLRGSEDIVESMKLFEERSADSIVSVVEANIKPEISNYLPVDLSLSGFVSEIKRTQDSQKLYQLNGAIYWLKRSLIDELSKVYRSDASFAYVMSQKDSVDIDTDFDFYWAEFLLSLLDGR